MNYAGLTWSSQNIPQQTMLQPESIWEYYDSCKNYNFLNILIREYNLIISNNNQKLFISVQTENIKTRSKMFLLISTNISAIWLSRSHKPVLIQIIKFMVPQTSSISSNPQVVWMGIFDMLIYISHVFEKVNSRFVWIFSFSNRSCSGHLSCGGLLWPY